MEQGRGDLHPGRSACDDRNTCEWYDHLRAKEMRPCQWAVLANRCASGSAIIREALGLYIRGQGSSSGLRARVAAAWNTGKRLFDIFVDILQSFERFGLHEAPPNLLSTHDCLSARQVRHLLVEERLELVLGVAHALG